MEFWASEVKSGESFKVQPGEGMVLHLSQASLGEIKKEKGETVCLFVNVDGKKLVLGTLFSDKLPQQQFDLVFDKDFELSHNLKNGSVYFYGYIAANPFEEEGEEDFDSESEPEDISLVVENGKPAAKAKEEKPAAKAKEEKPAAKAKEEKPADARKANAEKEPAAGKQKVKIVEPSTVSGEDEDSSDDESVSQDEYFSDEDDYETDSDDEEDEEDDSEEETPKKVATGKKRAADSAIETPVPDKKAKLATPQKTDGKKGGGHVATPHPSKQAGKTPANKNQQTPKSGGGSHKCKSCSRTFGSENALESHSKAKHSGGK